MINNIKPIYDNYRNIEYWEKEEKEQKDNDKFEIIDQDSKLKFILFPFQDKLLLKEIREKKRLYNKLMAMRIIVLDELIKYILKTKRFEIMYGQN